MNRRTLFTALSGVVRDQGRKLAARHGRPLGEKLAARLSSIGIERGLLQQPLDLDALLKRLRELHASGAISSEELRDLGKKLKDHALDRFRKS